MCHTLVEFVIWINYSLIFCLKMCHTLVQFVKCISYWQKMRAIENTATKLNFQARILREICFLKSKNSDFIKFGDHLTENAITYQCLIVVSCTAHIVNQWLPLLPLLCRRSASGVTTISATPAKQGQQITEFTVF